MDNLMFSAFADEANDSIEGQIAALKRNGFNGIEIRSVDGENISTISIERVKEIKKLLDSEGIKTWSIGSPIGKIDIVKDDFNAHLETYKHVIEIAHTLECENIRMFSFYMPKDADYSIYKNEVIERMGKFVEIASKEQNIVLCHENEKGIYGDIPERCLEIHKAYPSLAGVFDPANYIQCNVDTLKGWNLIKPYIKYLHIKDCLADGKVVPAGSGIGNLKAIVSDFIANGGKAFSVEPHLTVFKALADLEQEDNKTIIENDFVYASTEEAFDIACKAFKALL